MGRVLSGWMGREGRGGGRLTRHSRQATHPQCHQHHPNSTLSSARVTPSPHAQQMERSWMRAQQGRQKYMRARVVVVAMVVVAKEEGQRAASTAGARVEGKENGCEVNEEKGVWQRAQLVGGFRW